MIEQALAIRNFKSGLITRVPSNAAPDDAFTDVQDIVLNDKYLPAKAKGHQKYNSSGLASAPVRGSCVYTKADGTRHYVVACGGKIYYSTAGSGTFTAYQIGDNDLTVDSSSDVEFVQYLNCLWVVNGKYPIITNNGYATSRMIKISGTTPSEVTSGPPQGGKYILVHQERVFILGSTDQPNGIYWSEPYLPETWTPAYGVNYDYVGKDDGENIAGGRSYQGCVYVGKPRNIYRYLTLGDITEWESRRVDTNLGWLFHRTIQEFQGLLVYLSPDGVAAFDGNKAWLISEAIRDKILELPQMVSNVRQWLQSVTADFDAGTVGTLIDTSDNEVKLKSLDSAADWQAGINNDCDIAVSPGDVKFVEINSMPSTLDHGACMARLGNYIYVLRGGGTSFWRYSIYDGSWAVKSSIPSAMSLHGSIVGDGSNYLYATIGPPNKNFYRYSVSEDTWTAMASLPLDISYPGLAYSSKGYVFAYTAQSAFYRYSVSEDAWYRHADPPTQLTGVNCMVCVGDYLYTTGTYGTQQYYRYDIVGNAWTSLADFPVTIIGGGTSTSDGTYIYVAQVTGLAVVYRYSISGNTWAMLAYFPFTFYASHALCYDGTYVYAVRGKDSSVMLRYSIKNNSWTLNPYFITKTLDFGFTPAAYGYLAAEKSGSVTFQTKSSDTDLSASEWEAADGWSTAQNNNTQITSTVRRYLRIRFNMPTLSGVAQLFVGMIWRSAKKDLGSVPAAWGNIECAYILNGQTFTLWMRSATTADGLDAATWHQQNPNTPVAGVTLYQHAQMEARFSTSSYDQQPSMDSVSVTYYLGSNLPSPCSVVWKDDYWLDVTPVGESANSVVFQYNKGGYWLKRTNKKNNVYFISEEKLLSGTSESDGYVRQNDVGTKDDSTDIDSYFVTKNFELVSMVKLFRRMMITSKSNASWTFSYSVDDGDYTDVTISAQEFPTTVKKILSGIVSGRFIKFKIRQSSEDANFEFHGADVVWSMLRELSAV